MWSRPESDSGRGSTFPDRGPRTVRPYAGGYGRNASHRVVITGVDHEPVRDRYIRLLQQCLTRELFIDEEPHRVRLDEAPDAFADLVRSRDWELVTLGGDAAARGEGR